LSKNLKVPITVSISLTLPVITHPCEYSGFVFQLLVQKDKSKNEFDILASGGRYDKLIANFKTSDEVRQCAVGVSFDFEKVVSLISAKSKAAKKSYRSELVVCKIGGGSSSQLSGLASHGGHTSSASLAGEQTGGKKARNQVESSNSHIHQDIRNRLRLFKQFSMINKSMNVATSIAHEKFMVRQIRGFK
jgi:histidyl-tRNA synthetase